MMTLNIAEARAKLLEIAKRKQAEKNGELNQELKSLKHVPLHSPKQLPAKKALPLAELGLGSQDEDDAERSPDRNELGLGGSLGDFDTTLSRMDVALDSALGATSRLEKALVRAEKKAAQDAGKPVLDWNVKLSVELNEKQLLAASYAAQGKPFCLIGAAGTGKTTSTKAVVTNLAKTIVEKFKLTDKSQLADYIALVSFTNRAVKNLAAAVEEIECSHLCRTIHKLLEYGPVPYSYINEAGEDVDSIRFEPARTAKNPIDTIQLVVVEEASMVSVELFKQLSDACPNATFLFIGDLNQLPPVFGSAILGFKLAELPVIELTQVYRQAMQSPIVGFQHQYTLAGRVPSDTDLQKMTAVGNGITFQPLKKYISEEDGASRAFAQFFHAQFKSGLYDPVEDVILCPYNKSTGTIAINRELAQLLGDDRQAEVYEIVAGFETHYYAPGDFVVWDRQEWFIDRITHNSQYIGKAPQPHSRDLTREGVYRNQVSIGAMLDEATHEEMEKFETLLASAMAGEDVGDLQNQASHVIHLVSLDGQTTSSVATRGDINKMAFGYCITIHKSQGSEWRKVYLVATKHHLPMLSRELLYTGMTRAKKELHVIYSPQSAPGRKDSSIAKSVLRQVIPGNSWQQKVEHFKGKYDEYQATMNA